MKVLAINGSPKKGSTTAAALKTVTDVLQSEGVDVIDLQVGDKEIRGCTGCNACLTRLNGRCIFDGDGVNDAIELSHKIDGLIIASPVYFAGIAGTMKCFLDRFFYSNNSFEYKPGLAIAAARRSGVVPTFSQLNYYLNLRRMIIVPTSYWAGVHGTNAEEFLQDKEGVSVLEEAGRNMAWLLKMLDSTKAQIPPPKNPPRARTNFIR